MNALVDNEALRSFRWGHTRRKLRNASLTIFLTYF